MSKGGKIRWFFLSIARSDDSDRSGGQKVDLIFHPLKDPTWVKLGTRVGHKMKMGVRFHFNEQTGLSSIISPAFDPFRIGWLAMIDANMEIDLGEWRSACPSLTGK